MDYPMRVYGLNLFELFLADLLTVLGWLMILFAVAAGFLPGIFLDRVFLNGILVATTAVTGIVQIMAGAGIRQNRAALDMSYFLFMVSGIGWTISGLFPLNIAPLAAGITILLLFGFAVFVRRQGVQARFKPRFFSLRQFETVIQIADTMIDTDGDARMNPIETAIRIDHLLAEIDSPTKEDIRTAVILVEWALPLLIFRPLPFSDLGSHQRRCLVEQLIDTRGPLRSTCRMAVRGLKVLATVGYYGSTDVTDQVGYLPFEQRDRSIGVDQTPKHYPDPFLQAGGK